MDDIEQVIEDLCLVDGVIPDYSLGRRRGLTDEETEKRAREAVSKAIELLEKQKEKLDKILEYVKAQEESYYNDASKALKENNITLYAVNIGKASTLQKIREFVENIIKD